MKRRRPHPDGHPNLQQLRQIAENLQREAEAGWEDGPRQAGSPREREKARRAGQETEVQEVWSAVPAVIHETPPDRTGVPGSGAVQFHLQAAGPLSRLPAGKVRQGLEVYALNELDLFEQAMRSLGVDLRATEVQLLWHPDHADARGREGLKVYPTAQLGERFYTLSAPSPGQPVSVAELSQAQWRQLAQAGAVHVGAAEWAALDSWRGFGGEPLRWVTALADNDWSWMVWVALLVAAFNIWWPLGMLWLFGSGYLFGKDGVKPYRAGYFEDHTPPSSFRELLWHHVGSGQPTASLLPRLRGAGSPAAQHVHAPTYQEPSPADLADQLPDDLAAGLRMVRSRVADLPQDEVLTASSYRLHALAGRCEEAARLYLRLPAGSEAAEAAAAEVRAMLEESLQALAGAGSRTRQQQEETLQAIRELRQTSVPVSDPLRLD